MSDPIRNMSTGIADIIKGAYEGKPVDVETAFNNAIQDKMQAAIAAKREEIANSIYGDEEPEEELEAQGVDVEEDEVEEPEENDEDLETEEESDEDV